MTPEEENAVLKAENARQREEIATLVARVQELEARLAKDSHTSSTPPSTDGVGLAARKTKRLRRRSGKKPGGQLGHRGQTRRLVSTPDDVVEHRPTVCSACQASLEQAPVVLRERRPVYELPPLRLVVREHQALHVCCPGCQTVTVGVSPTQAPSRAQYGPRLRALGVYLVEQQLVPYGPRLRELLADLFGASVSLGTLVGWVRRGAATLTPVEAQITAALRQAPVLHGDETGVRRGGRLAWAPVASTSRLTHYAIHAIHAKRGAEATETMGILPHFTGGGVHDGWAAERAHTGCRHALCTIHHFRELTLLEEHYHQGWAKDLKGLLLEMKAVVEQARTCGRRQLPATAREEFVTRCRALLATGHAANPPPDPERRPRQRGRLKQTPARNLLERLWLGQDQALAFLDDLSIPFDNTQAERDLRMLKVPQKVSGSFRADSGAAAFACLRGYFSTLRKQGVALLAARETLCNGQPLYPSFA